MATKKRPSKQKEVAQVTNELNVDADGIFDTGIEFEATLTETATEPKQKSTRKPATGPNLQALVLEIAKVLTVIANISGVDATELTAAIEAKGAAKGVRVSPFLIQLGEEVQGLTSAQRHKLIEQVRTVKAVLAETEG